MDRRQAIALLATSAPALAQTGKQRPIVGCWKLRSSERTFRDGHKEYHWGREPVGRIEYDKSGRMFALLMRPDRKCSLAPGMDLDTAPENELRNVVTGFTAYFGSFEVDDVNHVIVHHVQAHVNPSSAGTDLKRGYHFENGSLVLTRVSPDGTSSDQMVFDRLPE